MQISVSLTMDLPNTSHCNLQPPFQESSITRHSEIRTTTTWDLRYLTTPRRRWYGEAKTLRQNVTIVKSFSKRSRTYVQLTKRYARASIVFSALWERSSVIGGSRPSATRNCIRRCWGWIGSWMTENWEMLAISLRNGNGSSKQIHPLCWAIQSCYKLINLPSRFED